MESPADYFDTPMDGEDVAYPCKGCGDILQEGKAFELAGNRWHINCFRCNTCGTLLDSDANLLLLGDGSLICNNCTYSCSACGNKIEDLAILTGDQAFCATCFRCRNCKRKIENLRYARTSQGIFCMSCHESLMTRKRKKMRAAVNAKNKEDSSLVDKSLPALPPNVSNATHPSNVNPGADPFSVDAGAPTELSPRPPPTYARNGSTSRSSSRRPQEPSPGHTPDETPQREGRTTLPTTTYRKHRHQAIAQASNSMVDGDVDDSFIPFASDQSAGSMITPNQPVELSAYSDQNNKDDRTRDKDYFSAKNTNKAVKKPQKTSARDVAVPNHPFPQEKGPKPSAKETMQIMDSIRRAQATSNRSDPAPRRSANGDDTLVQHVDPETTNATGQIKKDRFRLGDVPKGKRSGSSRSDSLMELEGDVRNSRLPSSTSLSLSPPRRESADEEPTELHGTSKFDPLQAKVSIEHSGTTRVSQDSKAPDDVVPRVSKDPNATSRKTPAGSKATLRKRLSSGRTKDSVGPSGSFFGPDSSSSSSSDTLAVTPTVRGKLNTAYVLPQSPENVSGAKRAGSKPSPPGQLGTSYTAPRAPLVPPPTSPRMTNKGPNKTHHSNGDPESPKLPRWSAGGDFTMEEDMARILGETDENSQSILRRASNAVRHGRAVSDTSNTPRQHGRSVSETATRTAASPRWPKIPSTGDSLARDINSPVSAVSPKHEDPVNLRKLLRNSEERVAELERQFATDKDFKSLNERLREKRKTVSVLDSQTEIMLRQLEVLAGYVERAKDSKKPMNIAELEDSAIKDFVQKLEDLKASMESAVEALYHERNELNEEKISIVADRDRALVEFEQLSTKNAQLAEMNNDLTHQIQERFKTQSNNSVDSRDGLGCYTQHYKGKSSVSVHMDDASMRPSTSTTVFGSANNFPQSMDQDSSIEPATVLSAPHVVNIRKGQARKFNWKKGGQTVAKGVSKGFKGAFSSNAQERNQWQGQSGDNIGMPYNMTVVPVDAPSNGLSLPSRPVNYDAAKQGGFGLFKKSNTMPKLSSNGAMAPAEHPSVLFGSDLVERADYERRNIPSVVTRCIEEVELRGMDIEGIYRKTGGSGQVKIIQEGFDKMEDYDISDPGLDITAVTSVLKQYFRKLPIPLLTFDTYDRILESTSIEDGQERCVHLRRTFSLLPPKHRDCLEFLVFHLARVTMRESENLMTPKNLAVVFAPTIMRDHILEREMSDMHAKNLAVQFVIEHSSEVFGTA